MFFKNLLKRVILGIINTNWLSAPRTMALIRLFNRVDRSNFSFKKLSFQDIKNLKDKVVLRLKYFYDIFTTSRASGSRVKRLDEYFRYRFSLVRSWFTAFNTLRFMVFLLFLPGIIMIIVDLYNYIPDTANCPPLQPWVWCRSLIFGFKSLIVAALFFLAGVVFVLLSGSTLSLLVLATLAVVVVYGSTTLLFVLYVKWGIVGIISSTALFSIVGFLLYSSFKYLTIRSTYFDVGSTSAVLLGSTFTFIFLVICPLISTTAFWYFANSLISEFRSSSASKRIDLLDQPSRVNWGTSSETQHLRRLKAGRCERI